MESLSMLRFMASHASTDSSSAMRFSTSCGSKVGTAMPGSGMPSGPHRRRNISKGSCGGVLSAMGPIFFDSEEFAYLGFARHGVLVSQVDERAAERLLEQQVARQVGARAVEGASGAQHEAHRGGQLVQEARSDALQGLRGRDEKHLHGAQVHARLRQLLGRDQLHRAVDALEALDVDRQAVEE